jgi:hypothetical protein
MMKNKVVVERLAELVPVAILIYSCMAVWMLGSPELMPSASIWEKISMEGAEDGFFGPAVGIEE